MPTLFKRHSVNSQNEILLSYEGELNFDLIQDFIDDVEGKMAEKNIRLQSIKRIYNVIVEIFQNLVNNIDFEEGLKADFNYNVATLKVWIEEDKCYIATGNYILNSNVEKLNAWMSRLNDLDKKELRELWSEIVSNGQFNSYGGAGLGFIEIKRRANSELDFSFKNVDSNFSYFNFEIFIPLDK